MREIEVEIDSEEIQEFVFKELIQRGFAPNKEEIEELADIMFDFLIHKEIINEEFEE